MPDEIDRLGDPQAPFGKAWGWAAGESEPREVEPAEDARVPDAPGADGPGEDAPGDFGPGEDTLLQRQLRATETSLERARVDAEQAASGAAELAERLRALEQAIMATSREPARLQGLLRQQERATRMAEQRLHAEGVRRQELEAELAELAARLERRAERIRSLEIAVEEQVRRADEAEHIAEVARTAQRKAERRLAETAQIGLVPTSPRGAAPAPAPAPPAVPPPVILEELQVYREAWRAIERSRTRLQELGRIAEGSRAALPTPHGSSDVAERPGTGHGLAAQPHAGDGGGGAAPPERAGPLDPRRAPVRGAHSSAGSAPAQPPPGEAGPETPLPTWIDGDRLSAALERLREAAAPREATAAELVPQSLDAEPASHRALGAEVAQGAAEHGNEPAASATAVPAEPPAPSGPSPVDAPAPSGPSSVDAPAPSGPSSVDAPAPSAQSPVEARPLVVASSEGGAGPVRPWLAEALRELGSADPLAAGRVTCALLPALHCVIDAPISFDLVLSDRAPLAVTADPAEGRTWLDPIAGPRAGAARSFALTGDTAGLGRLATAGPLRVRFGRRVARADGRRRLPEPLRALVRSPLSIAQLDAAAVALDPGDVMRLLAIGLGRVAPPDETLLLLHEPPGGGPRAGIAVRPGHAPRFLPSEAAETGDGEATVVVCDAADLLPVLAGTRPAAEVRGPGGGLEPLAGWVARMQSP